MNWVFPLPKQYLSRLTSPYGWRFHPKITNKDGTPYHHFHNGCDFGAPTGEKIKPCAKGQVIEVNYKNRNGNYIRIRHENGWVSTYCHLHKVYVEPYVIVDINTEVGEVGDTGVSTAPHLHFTMYTNWTGNVGTSKHIDPMTLFTS